MNEEQIKALVAQLMAAGGFLTKSEFNSTAAMIRGLKETQDRSGNPMDALVTAGLLMKNADGTYSPKEVASIPAKKDDANTAMQAQITQLVEQGAAKDKLLASEQAKRADGELRSAVVAAFEKAGAVNASRDFVHVLGSVKRADDGSFHTVSKDSFGVETNVGLDVAFGAFLKGNPELMKPAGRPGSGTPANGNTTSSAVGSTASYMASRTKDLADGDIRVTF